MKVPSRGGGHEGIPRRPARPHGRTRRVPTLRTTPCSRRKSRTPCSRPAARYWPRRSTDRHADPSGRLGAPHRAAEPHRRHRTRATESLTLPALLVCVRIHRPIGHRYLRANPSHRSAGPMERASGPGHPPGPRRRETPTILGEPQVAIAPRRHPSTMPGSGLLLVDRGRAAIC